MRRLLVLLAGVCLTHAAGCYHVGGKCDCVPPVQPCCIYGLYPPAAGYPVMPAAPVVAQQASASQGTTTPVANEVPAELPPAKPMKEQIGLPREL
jgi:hypothetical protein